MTGEMEQAMHSAGGLVPRSELRRMAAEAILAGEAAARTTPREVPTTADPRCGQCRLVQECIQFGYDACRTTCFPAVPGACRRCQNWCHYYGDPDHAAMCQSADDQQQAELEATRG